MNRFLRKYRLVVAVLAASVIGSVTTIGVFAAIPSAQGIINGCRGKVTGQLRLVDPRIDCGFGQENVRWDKGVVAYAYFSPVYASTGMVYTIPTNKSFNVSIVPTIPPNQGTCLEFGGTIEKSIRFITKGGADMDRAVSLRTDSADVALNMTSVCGPHADALIDSYGGDFYLSAF